MRKLTSGLVLVGSLIAGCGQPGNVEGTEGAGPGALSTRSGSLVVLHTRTQLLVSDSATWSGSFKQKLEDYFPAACLDSDSDGDGVPDSMDIQSSDDSTSSSDRACNRCNRGPGTEGDFRLKVDGNEVELARGRVASRSEDSVTVIGPDGAITILLDGDTEFRDGEPHPGAEIRAEGVKASGERTFLASRLKVLCPAPTPMDFPELPADATPVPTLDESGSVDDDGTPDQGSGDFGGDDSATPGDDDGTPDQGSGDAGGDDSASTGDDDGTPDQGSGDAIN